MNLDNLDDTGRYAMHFGLLMEQEVPATFRLEIAMALESSGLTSVSLHVDGDNCFEWGETIDEREDTLAQYASGDLEAEEMARALSAHFYLYVPKGIDPRLVFDAIEVPLGSVALCPAGEGGFSGSYADRNDRSYYPFVVDEAAAWGENVSNAWKYQPN